MKRDWLICGAVLLAIAILGIRHSGEDERLAVSRLGLASRIAGPGLTWQLPFVEDATRLELDSAVADWRSLDEEEIESRALAYAVENGLFPE